MAKIPRRIWQHQARGGSGRDAATASSGTWVTWRGGKAQGTCLIGANVKIFARLPLPSSWISPGLTSHALSVPN